MHDPPDQTRRPFLRACQVAATVALAAFAAHAALGFGEGLDSFFNDWVYNGLVVAAALSCLVRAARVREDRFPWLVMGLGLAAWSVAEIYNTTYLARLDDPPYPSLSDAFWVAFYPLSYVALVLLVRRRMQAAHASLWLDGVIAGLAVAAVGETLVFQPVLESTSGTPLEVATDLVYPLGDLLLLALVVAVFGLTGWRAGRAWTLLGAGLAAMAAADGVYAYQAAQGTYVEGNLLDALWPAATLLVGFAPWEPAGARGSDIRLSGWRMLVLPTTFALMALGVLVYDHFERVDGAAVLMASTTLLAVIVRMAMTFGENLRMLASSQEEALTDALTGLGNRRRLMADLQAGLEGAGDDRPDALVLFDLDGFKRYNDDFGHPAGDALLARLGRNLEAAVRPYGTAYRLGGDEFCALVRTDAPGASPIIAAALAALSDHGRGFVVAASYGSVLLPHEAADARTAMQIADRRLYGHKGQRRVSAVGEATRDVLMQILHEREPALQSQMSRVADLALAVGRRLALDPEELDEMARAAELHDIGKMAIPDEILSKPGPLDEVELGFIRQHTLVGERILAAAPALAPVARIVRMSHENWDGSGYPDGVAGDDIPLASRIIAVCDAYHAMTTDRPYKKTVGHDEALAELLRCAGSHFDPTVVAVFCEVAADRPAPGPGSVVADELSALQVPAQDPTRSE
jgi:two-component system cell cycle response regulator